MFRLLVLLFSLGASLGIAQAQVQVWSGASHVTEVYAGYTDGRVYVRGMPKVSPTCTSDLVFFGPNSNPTHIMMMAVAAQVSNKRLDCLLEANQCDSGYQVGHECKLVD